MLVYEPDLRKTFSETPPEVSFANLIASKLLASSKSKISINESGMSFLETLFMNVYLSLVSPRLI